VNVPMCVGNTRSSWPGHAPMRARRAAQPPAPPYAGGAARRQGSGAALAAVTAPSLAPRMAAPDRHFTRTCPADKSTSRQCSASASPRRRPVPSISTTRGCSRSPLAASRSGPASAGVRIASLGPLDRGTLHSSGDVAPQDSVAYGYIEVGAANGVDEPHSRI